MTGVFTRATSRTFYVDGKSVGTNTTNIILPATAPVTVRLTVGALLRSTSTSGTDHFAGAIDEVGYFDNALTLSDVAAIHGLGRTGGIGLDQFDEAQMLFASAPGAQGQIGGFTWERATGLSGTAGDFSGTTTAGNATIVMDAAGNGLRQVPEPSAFITAVSGAGLLLLRRRRSQSADL